MLTVTNESGQLSLMQALGFSEYDLEANRKGHLSSGQRRDIQIEGFCAIVILIFITTLGLTGGGLAIISGDRLQILGGFLIIALMVVLPSIIAWGMSRHYSRILSRGEIRKMRGKIGKGVSGGGKNGTQHKIYLGGEVFNVSQSVFYAFIEDREYYLYIAPHVKQILSAELSLRELNHVVR